MATLYSNNIALYIDKSIDIAEFYYSRIINLSSFYNTSIVFDSFKDGDDDDKYKDLLQKYNNNGGMTTIVLLKDVTSYQTLITARSGASVVIDQFQLLLLEGGIVYDDIIAGGATPESNSFFVTSYNENVINAINTDFKNIINTDVVTRSTLSISFGIMNALSQKIDKIKNNDIHVILSYIYNEKFEFPGGDIYILPSHFMTTTHYLLKVESPISLNNVIDADIYLNPNGYIFQIEETSCRFDKNIVDGNYTNDYLPIIFIQDMTLNVSKVITSYITLLFNNLTTEVYNIYLEYYEW